MILSSSRFIFYSTVIPPPDQQVETYTKQFHRNRSLLKSGNRLSSFFLSTETSMENFKHAGDEPKHVNTSGIISATVPSFAAASELLSAPYSCLVMNTHRRHIALPPKYLQKKRTGIQEELEGELLRFSER